MLNAPIPLRLFDCLGFAPGRASLIFATEGALPEALGDSLIIFLLVMSEVEGPVLEKATTGGAAAPATSSIDEKDCPGAPTRLDFF